jgi:hypothetical protein
MLDMVFSVVMFITWCVAGTISPDAAGIYRDTLTIILPIEKGPGFQLSGVIVVTNTDVGSWTMDHEYGHALQQREMGIKQYLAVVGLSSIIGNISGVLGMTDYRQYHSLPWERDADERGGYHP